MTLGKLKRERNAEGRTVGAELDTGVRIDTVFIDMPLSEAPLLRMRGTSLLYKMTRTENQTLAVILGPGFFAGKDKVNNQRIYKRIAKALDELRFKVTPKSIAWYASVRLLTEQKPKLMDDLLINPHTDVPKQMAAFYTARITAYTRMISELGNVSRTLITNKEES